MEKEKNKRKETKRAQCTGEINIKHNEEHKLGEEKDNGHIQRETSGKRKVGKSRMT
jgi:hypothetical protein